jgi:type I restriction enzyme M protein
VHAITAEAVETTQVFTLSQVYESLLLKMGERNNDGGQFFTPREVVRVMVRAIDPGIGETVYDPGCGTGGFLAQTYEHMAGPDHTRVESPDQLATLKRRTYYVIDARGREVTEAIAALRTLLKGGG